MRLAVGNTLGPYEILEPAGAGGMGEVYKARDGRLDRTVAVKVLPGNVSHDPDLKQRFEREAKVISSLNHPNICVLHDIGSENGTDYLVMEYLDGETLDQRLKRGPLPAPEMLQVAIQIADALDNAHRMGLVHRDLKPGNVMLTKEGAKLLDFGLAKLQLPGGPADGISAITQTTPLTGAGTVLGTLNYMSPEQLEGQESDARSDIFAFGALLYEMATGQRAFEGKSQASVVASILEREPAPISSINSLTPPALERLVKKCLSKDPDKRWQSARDMADELKWISQAGSQAGIPLNVSVRRRIRIRLAWGVAATLAAVAFGFGFLWFTRPVPERPVQRFKITTQADLSTVNWPRPSPDGKLLAFLASDGSGPQKIWVRPMNSLDAYPLAGTEDAGRPFWSPDSRYLAYFSDRSQLKKIAVAGGPAQLIGEAEGASDGTWGTGGVIVFDGGVGDSLRQISASGGQTFATTRIDRDNDETFHAWPWFLPDGKHFLYLAGLDQSTNQAEKYLLKVGSLDTTEASINLFSVDTRIEYSASGYIVFVRAGILLAQAFDADKLEVTGEPIPIAEQVALGGGLDLAHFGISNQGTLIYQNDVNAGQNELVWIDREGNESGRIGETGQYDNVDLSPDGRKLAYGAWDDGQRNMDLWIRDLDRGVSSRLTFGTERDIWPIWSADSRDVYYASDADGRFAVMKKAASGTGEAVTVFAADSGNIGPTDFSVSDGSLICTHIAPNPDVVRIDPSIEPARIVLYSTPFADRFGRISPNGRYLAFENNESGKFEVYVLDLSESGGKWQVSSDGGRRVKWRADGKELYYVDDNWNFMAVPVSTTGDFTIGNPQKLFTCRLATTGFGNNRYSVTPDGQRFLVNRPLEASGGGEFTVVLNWDEELKAR